jgi:hypothetical protein
MSNKFHLEVTAPVEHLSKILDLALPGIKSVWGLIVDPKQDYYRDAGVDEAHDYKLKGPPCFILFTKNNEEMDEELEELIDPPNAFAMRSLFSAPISVFPVQTYVDPITEWLKRADYGQKPGLDGECRKGFYLTTGSFYSHNHILGMGYIIQSHTARAEIRPCWMVSPEGSRR